MQGTLKEASILLQRDIEGILAVHPEKDYNGKGIKLEARTPDYQPLIVIINAVRLWASCILISVNTASM